MTMWLSKEARILQIKREARHVMTQKELAERCNCSLKNIKAMLSVIYKEMGIKQQHGRMMFALFLVRVRFKDWNENELRDEATKS